MPSMKILKTQYTPLPSPLRRIIPQFETPQQLLAPGGKIEIRKQRVEQFKRGTHPQMWRTGSVRGSAQGAFAKLGSTAFMSNTLLFECMYDDGMCEAVGIDPFDALQLFYANVYIPLKLFLFNMIDKIVPSDTNTLRETIKQSLLTSSQVNTYPFRVFINTGDLEYARPVNNMPSSNLRHQGEQRRSRINGVMVTRTLNDPQAQKGFFYTLTREGRAKAKELYYRMLSRIIATRVGVIQFTRLSGGRPYNVAQKCFKIRFKEA